MRKKDINNDLEKVRKSDVIGNTPSRLLRRYIKLANLVSSDFELGRLYPDQILFNGSTPIGFIPFSEIGFDKWAKENGVDQQPKLLRYLRYLHNKKTGGYWKDALKALQSTKNFMQALVDIAVEYQKTVESIAQFEKKRRNELELQIANGLTPKIIDEESENIFSSTNLMRRVLSLFSYADIHSPVYAALSHKQKTDAFFTRQHSSSRDQLLEKLYKSAFGFISLEIKDGRANLSFGGFLEVIQNTDFRRLKKCVVCQNILWANPLNKKFCSLKCANRQLQRNLRADPDRLKETNEKRRENYYYKRGVSYCKKCIYPNAKCICNQTEKEGRSNGTL